MKSPEPLITVTPRGLYCPRGSFYIDPWQPVQTAVITHAHGDHLRPGHERYLMARDCVAIARTRLASDPVIGAFDYGAASRLGDVRVSFHPAGHILGSSQIRIECDGRVWVVSGDFKRAPDPTCAPFEPQRCDVFVSEATFALPVYRWPPAPQVVGELYRWWQANRDRGIASIVGCYALGKAQRVLAELAAYSDEPVYTHGAVESLVQVYRDAGVRMPPTLPATGERKRDYAGALVLAPPAALGSTWIRRFGDGATAFCSGWMRIRGNRRRRGYDRGFVLSDHADWPALLATFRDTGAQRILLTHGHSQTLCRYLVEQGYDAAALETAYGAEE